MKKKNRKEKKEKEGKLNNSKQTHSISSKSHS